MPINTITKAKLDRLQQLGFNLKQGEIEREPTEAECLMVSCPSCNAVRDEPCTTYHIISTNRCSGFIHAERRELGKHRINTLQDYDKALIIQYAFLGVCASVSANSDKLLGKVFSPEDVEAFFCNSAIKELIEAGYFRQPVIRGK